jgi:preprotein translocase subunit YajC
MSLLLIPLFLLVAYFLLLRPQQQRARRQQTLVTSIGEGDYVVTAGGIVGRVVVASKDRMQLEIADGIVVEFLRQAISRRLDPSEASLSTLSAVDEDFDDDEEAEEPEDGEEVLEEEEPEGTEPTEGEEAPTDDETASADEAGEESEEATVTDAAQTPTAEQDPH